MQCLLRVSTIINMYKFLNKTYERKKKYLEDAQNVHHHNYKELETVHKIGNYKVVITAINLE